jgi:hypothetical protein
MAGHIKAESLDWTQLAHAVLVVALDDIGLLPSAGPARGIRTAIPVDWRQRA